MQVFLLFFIFFLPLTTFASKELRRQYRVQSEIVQNGVILYSPMIMALEGEESLISTGSVESDGSPGPNFMKMKVVAWQDSLDSNRIRLRMEYKYRSSEQEAKGKTHLSLRNKESARWILSTSNGSPLEIVVTAERQ